MKKNEYLDLLRYYLSNLPKNVVDDIINDYEEHFSIGLENNKTEEEISDELGSPKFIAEQFLETERVFTNKKVNESDFINNNPENSTISKILKIVFIIVGFIFLSPVILAIFGLIMGIFGGLIGLGGMVVGLVIFSIVIFLSSFPFFFVPSFISVPYSLLNLHPLTKISVSIFTVCLSILLIIILYKIIILFIKGIKNILISIKWQFKKRWDDNEK